MNDTPHLKLPYIMPSQAQKHVTHNEALLALDMLVQLAVIDRDLSAPPVSPSEGDRYIVAAGGSGAWAGQDGKVAAWSDGAWVFHAPLAGWIAWAIDEATLIHWTGSSWANFAAAVTTLQNLSLLGLGTTADAVNQFSAKLNKALWTAKTAAEGGDGDLRFTVNKEAAADTASLLMQSGFSGRAEIGLIGDNNLTIKVSPDGATFRTALIANRYSGKVTFPKGVVGLKPANAVLRNRVTGATWLASTSAADENWLSVAWAPELALFAAVANTGTGNRVMTSPDGVAWTIRTSAADNSWSSVCWSPELRLFAAVGNSGAGNRVMTSPDGVAWTIRTSAANNSWRTMCWSPELGLFCAIADSGTGNRVMTSPDGIAWTIRTSAADNDWRGICWAPDLGLFVATAVTGAGNRVMTSPDGVAWTLRTSAADNNWSAVCWAPELGLLAAVATTGAGNRVMTSPDGITWTLRTSAADNTWNRIAWAGEIGLFAAVASSGTDRVMTSPDGIAWTTRGAASANGWNGLCWSPELGLFASIANSGTGNRAMTSVSAWSFTYRS